MNHLLEPEVAGGLGPDTVMDTSSHPPTVSRLHYEIEGWSGDDLIESTPCFLISPQAGAALAESSLTGFRLADAKITIEQQAQGTVDERITGFRWLQVPGLPDQDDLAAAPDGSLVVSDRALEVLQRFQLTQCDVSAWSPA